MADRIFAGLLMLVTLGYAYLALFVIRARIQYDPLGPESWPQILAFCTVACLIFVFARPESIRMEVTRHTLFRLLSMLALMVAYAWLYEPLGFIVSTFLFSTVVAMMLGAEARRAALFGLGMGVLGYVLCVLILELNLPDGLLELIIGHVDGQILPAPFALHAAEGLA
jgi:putative tricarboxylic transport membrane protein